MEKEKESVSVKISSGAYRNTLPYPDRKAINDKMWEEFQKQPPKTMSHYLSMEALKADIKKAEDEFHANVKKVVEEMKTKYYEKERARMAMFKKDLEEENGVENNPKKEKLWEIAWSKGHDSGLAEVRMEYEYLSDLIKD